MPHNWAYTNMYSNTESPTCAKDPRKTPALFINSNHAQYLNSKQGHRVPNTTEPSNPFQVVAFLSLTFVAIGGHTCFRRWPGLRHT